MCGVARWGEESTDVIELDEMNPVPISDRVVMVIFACRPNEPFFDFGAAILHIFSGCVVQIHDFISCVFVNDSSLSSFA
jgi:hypothetical protein